MKNMTKAFVVGGLMVLAQAALANDSVFPSYSDDAGGRLPPNITHADLHAKDPVTAVRSAFPSKGNDAGGRLAAKVTHATRHANEPMTTTASAFPGAVDDAGAHLPARVTYADRHLDKPTRISQPNQDSGISAN